MLVRTRELVEQRSLATILIAHKRTSDGLIRREHMPGGTRPENRLVSFSQRRVCHTARGNRVFARNVMRVVNVHELDTRCIGTAQRELVIAQANLKRVAHRRVLHHGDLSARRKTHVKNVLMKRWIVRINAGDNGIFTDFQRVQSHAQVLSECFSAHHITHGPTVSKDKVT